MDRPTQPLKNAGRAGCWGASAVVGVSWTRRGACSVARVGPAEPRQHHPYLSAAAPGASPTPLSVVRGVPGDEADAELIHVTGREKVKVVDHAVVTAHEGSIRACRLGNPQFVGPLQIRPT